VSSVPSDRTLSARLPKLGLSPHDLDKESRTPVDVLQLRKQVAASNQAYSIVRRRFLLKGMEGKLFRAAGD